MPAGSNIGKGAVLEQDSHVIADASRALTKSEKQYNVIQRECLILVCALKQFHPYLIGRSFNLITDHAPLQWLSVKKMEGLLYHWCLSLQEYDFQIKYHRGIQNGNADALSRCMETLLDVPSAPTVILLDYSAEQIKTSPRRRTNNQTTSDSITEIIRMPLHTQMNTSSSSLLLTAAQL